MSNGQHTYWSHIAGFVLSPDTYANIDYCFQCGTVRHNVIHLADNGIQRQVPGFPQYTAINGTINADTEPPCQKPNVAACTACHGTGWFRFESGEEIPCPNCDTPITGNKGADHEHR